MTNQNLEADIEEMIEKEAEALAARAKVHIGLGDNKMWVNNPEFLTLLRAGAEPFILNSRSERGDYTQEAVYQGYRFITSTKGRLQVFPGTPSQKEQHEQYLKQGCMFHGVMKTGSEEWQKYMGETVKNAALRGVIQRGEINLGDGYAAHYLRRIY